MKLFVLISICISLIAGCVHSEFGWRPIMPYGGPYIKEYTISAHYQENTTLNHTNSVQRMKDAVSCGVKNGDKSFRSAMSYNNGPIINRLVVKFDSCMASKGYVYISDCGLRIPTDKDKGLCNE